MAPAARPSFRHEELHLWTFDGAGKGSRFRRYGDTAKHIAAAGAGWGVGGWIRRPDQGG